ncbi:hypothetical protein SDC9_138724 [bioreactor metagenome]|uniref:Uncharacterized protein n=1 Tax=bioreactor metagenome TaxID=1076179 RepID=A0A645DSD8_9ZZZZ
MEKLVEYSFTADKQVYLEKGKELQSITLKYKAIPFIGPTRTIKVPVTLHKDISLYETGLTPELNYNIDDISPWKLSADKPVGKVDVKIRNYSESYELFPNISKMQIIKDNALYYILALLALIIIVSSIIIIRIKFKRKKRRKKSLFR